MKKLALSVLYVGSIVLAAVIVVNQGPTEAEQTITASQKPPCTDVVKSFGMCQQVPGKLCFTFYETLESSGTKNVIGPIMNSLALRCDGSPSYCQPEKGLLVYSTLCSSE